MFSLSGIFAIFLSREEGGCDASVKSWDKKGILGAPVCRMQSFVLLKSLSCSQCRIDDLLKNIPL